jgi:hypothetical protein
MFAPKRSREQCSGLPQCPWGQTPWTLALLIYIVTDFAVAAKSVNTLKFSLFPSIAMAFLLVPCLHATRRKVTQNIIGGWKHVALGGNARPGCVEVFFHAAGYTKNSVPLAERMILGRISLFPRTSFVMKTTRTTARTTYLWRTG